MRDEKKILLDEIKEKIEGSGAMIVTRYDKLPPNGSWSLRDELAKTNCQYEVVRKRVFVKAAEHSGIKIDESLLLGHIGVAFATEAEAMASAKALLKYSEDNAQAIQFLLGRIEGKIIPGSEVEILAKLPGMDELRAQFIALLVAPMSQLLAVFEAAMEGPLAGQTQNTEN
jgi:large subunit ribosomal protein L10